MTFLTIFLLCLFRCGAHSVWRKTQWCGRDGCIRFYVPVQCTVNTLDVRIKIWRLSVRERERGGKRYRNWAINTKMAKNEQISERDERASKHMMMKMGRIFCVARVRALRLTTSIYYYYYIRDCRMQSAYILLSLHKIDESTMHTCTHTRIHI